jgi:hypothetical protein
MMMIFVLSALCAHGASATSAAEAYADAEFATAASEYTTLIDERGGTPALFHNRGNAYFRSGELGEAIADYRRGLTLSPNDPDLKSNLKHARTDVQDAVLPPMPSALARTLAFWHFGLSHWAMTVTMLVSNLFFWVLLGVRRVSPRTRWFRVAILAFALVAVGSAGSWAKQTWWPTKIGVVTSADLSVLAGVHEGAVVRFVLHEGVEVLVVDEAPPWAQVVIDHGENGENGESGWVSAASLAIVEIK